MIETAGRAGITAAEAAPSGSDQRKTEAIETHEKPPESGGFSIFPSTDMTGEYPAGLLDIGGSLC
jgi:hypothetical protein